MRWFHLLTALVILGAAAAVGLLIAEEPPARGRYYLEDDVQHFPTSPIHLLPAHRGAVEAHHPVLGELLFSDVTYVQFVGPGHPANSDGSLGAIATDSEKSQLAIYERYIIKDVAASDEAAFRTLYPYDKLGRIEQRLAPSKVKP